MCEQDIAARRKRDLERYHRRTAERREKGLCLKCGKRPPAPGRSRCEPCAAKKRPADRARHHRRTEARIAQGMCPKCGKRPPEPGRSQCGPCLEKDAAAGRARDARLRDAGVPRRDRETARKSDRARYHRQAAERREAGLCLSCGKRPVLPERSQCEPCNAQRREDERERYARAKAQGKLYGGRNPETRRRLGRKRSRKRLHARLEAGLCTRCGREPPVEGGTTCEPCREVRRAAERERYPARRAAERERYAARRAAGLCVDCAEPTLDGGARCGPCAVRRDSGRSRERRNAAARRLYARRRAQGLCTDCGAPSQGAARCEPCARRSYERSTYFRGMPLYPPRYTVVELDTGDDHGTFDSWEDVALCLAFARLSLDEVEVLTDQSPVATWAAWE